jgi:hypothetical protein
MTGKKNQVNKIDAVRQALDNVGQDAPRPKLQEFIKEKFGYVMSTDHISNCKSELKRRARKRKPVVARATVTTSPVQKPAAPMPQVHRAVAHVQQMNGTAGANGSVGGISLLDIGAVKGLLGRVGADELKGLIDVLHG